MRSLKIPPCSSVSSFIELQQIDSSKLGFLVQFPQVQKSAGSNPASTKKLVKFMILKLRSA